MTAIQETQVHQLTLLQRLTASGARLLRDPMQQSVSCRCHSGVKFPSVTKYILILVLFIMPTSWSGTTTPTKWHPVADIRATATNFVTQHTRASGNRTTVTSSALDSRLRLNQCDVQLEAFLPAGRKVAAHTTVGVRCKSPRAWKLFVPVYMSVSADILVAAESLPAGTVLNDSHLLNEERDLSALHGGYIRAGESVTGMVLRRNLQAGQPLRNALLTAPKIVRRGQQITIRSASGPVNIRMAGTAMSDGRHGQRIQVKNRSSGRVIEGIVRSSEIVEIGYE